MTFFRCHIANSRIVPNVVKRGKLDLNYGSICTLSHRGKRYFYLKGEKMAYKFIDEDGDEAVKFEHGKWDSLMGYFCPECKTYFGDPEQAMYHENNLPCQDDDKYDKVYWQG